MPRLSHFETVAHGSAVMLWPPGVFVRLDRRPAAHQGKYAPYDGMPGFVDRSMATFIHRQPLRLEADPKRLENEGKVESVQRVVWTAPGHLGWT